MDVVNRTGCKSPSKSDKTLVENSINGDRFGKLISMVHPKIKDVCTPRLSWLSIMPLLLNPASKSRIFCKKSL